MREVSGKEQLMCNIMVKMGIEVETAKKIITEELEKERIKVEKVIVFGSRARGDFHKGSDWDFFVVVNKELNFTQKRAVILRIRRRMAETRIPNDIIIQAEAIVNQRKNNTGYITYYALKEGIDI